MNISEDVDHSNLGPEQALLISKAALRTAEIVLDLCLVTILALLGLVTNVINLIVFSKLGFQDSVNISMATIAIWDLLKCVCAVVLRGKFFMGLVSEAHRESWANVMTPTVMYFQVFASYVSYVLAAYVAFERCLCVSIPFKVKSLITPQTTKVMMIILTLAVFGTFAVIFFIYDIKWGYSPEYNQTIIIYAENDFYLRHGEKVMTYFNAFGLTNPVFSLFVIIISTIIIIHNLRKMSRFRMKSQPLKTVNFNVNDNHVHMLTPRDRQVIRMLLVIILVYVITLLPRLVHHIGKILEPEFYYLRKYSNLFHISVHTVFVSDYINSSVNLFIFLSMSTNFRDMFLQIFPYCRRRTKTVS